MKRRNFIISTALSTAALGTPFIGYNQELTMKRKFKLCLNPGSIGVNLDQRGLLEAAIKHSYEAIVSMPSELATWSTEELDSFKDKMNKNGITWGSTNLPVQFREDEQTFKASLATLSKTGEVLYKVGATRMNTWIMPTHPTLSYLDNMKQHARRLGECAKILAEYDVQLGLEYVGPKTLMARDRYPFIHTFGECMELIENTGQKNVGIQLDCFHWFCGEDTIKGLMSLRPNQIVTVDLNDARSDLTRDEQIDGTRELVGTTGVVDIVPFFKALVEIGYDGPVRSEPFNKKLNEMEDEKAMALDIKNLRKVLKKVGIK